MPFRGLTAVVCKIVSKTTFPEKDVKHQYIYTSKIYITYLVVIFHNITSNALPYLCTLSQVPFLKKDQQSKAKRTGFYISYGAISDSEIYSFISLPAFIAALQKRQKLD